MHPRDRHGHLIPHDPKHPSGRQDSGRLDARTLGIHPMPGLGKHNDVVHAVRQPRVLRDAPVPGHAGHRRGLGSHRLRGLHRVNEDAGASQQLAHLAGARPNVGGSQGDASAGHAASRGSDPPGRTPAPRTRRRPQQGSHGLVRVGGAHRVVGTPLAHEGISPIRG